MVKKPVGRKSIKRHRLTEPEEDVDEREAYEAEQLGVQPNTEAIAAIAAIEWEAADEPEPEPEPAPADPFPIARENYDHSSGR